MIRLGSNSLSLVSAQKGSAAENGGSGRTGRSEHREDSVALGKTYTDGGNTMKSLAMKHKAQRAQESQLYDMRDQLNSALGALPRDSEGEISPELLVDSDRTLALTEAVERLVLEGLGSGAEIAFERAVHKLFVEYADDLSLDSSELEKARDQLLSDVRDVVSDSDIRPWEPGQPAPAMMNLEKAVEMLQAKVMERRQLVLEASGDLSRVLSELTIQAQNGDEEDIARLGDFLDRFSDAVKARSSAQIREDARGRLLEGNPLAVVSPDDEELGEAFLARLDEVSGV